MKYEICSSFVKMRTLHDHTMTTYLKYFSSWKNDSHNTLQSLHTSGWKLVSFSLKIEIETWTEWSPAWDLRLVIIVVVGSVRSTDRRHVLAEGDVRSYLDNADVILRRASVVLLVNEEQFYVQCLASIAGRRSLPVADDNGYESRSPRNAIINRSKGCMKPAWRFISWITVLIKSLS
jgi:hypothetical protein